MKENAKKTARRRRDASSPVAEGLVRVFRFSSVELADIGTDKSPEEVKDFYSSHYPELVNATIKGPKLEGGREVWDFTPVSGTKG